MSALGCVRSSGGLFENRRQVCVAPRRCHRWNCNSRARIRLFRIYIAGVVCWRAFRYWPASLSLNESSSAAATLFGIRLYLRARCIRIVVRATLYGTRTMLSDTYCRVDTPNHMSKRLFPRLGKVTIGNFNRTIDISQEFPKLICVEKIAKILRSYKWYEVPSCPNKNLIKVL